MKALVLQGHGGADQLRYVEDFPMPEPGPDEVLIRIAATSLNRIDFVVRHGYPGLSVPMPHILGGDIAGEVVGLGENVHELKAGDKIVAYPMIWCGHCEMCDEGKTNLCLNWQYFGMHRHGGYAEYAAIPARNCIVLPEGISYEESTALGVAGLTAYHGIVSEAELRPGQSFLIWGGSGGLGSIAVQLAKLRGATVITTVGKDEKKAALLELGADHVFNHNSDNVFEEVKKLFPTGVDAVMDYVGPKTFQQSFELLKKGGRMILCGMLTGREVTLNIQQTYIRHLSLRGIYLGTKAEMEELVRLVADGKVRPHIAAEYELRDGAKAHELLASGDYVGKIVLKP